MVVWSGVTQLELLKHVFPSRTWEQGVLFCFLVSRSQTLFGNACLEALLHGRLVWSDTAGAVKACAPK